MEVAPPRGALCVCRVSTTVWQHHSGHQSQWSLHEAGGEEGGVSTDTDTYREKLLTLIYPRRDRGRGRGEGVKILIGFNAIRFRF